MSCYFGLKASLAREFLQVLLTEIPGGGQGVVLAPWGFTPTPVTRDGWQRTKSCRTMGLNGPWTSLWPSRYFPHHYHPLTIHPRHATLSITPSTPVSVWTSRTSRVQTFQPFKSPFSWCLIRFCLFYFRFCCILADSFRNNGPLGKQSWWNVDLERIFHWSWLLDYVLKLGRLR